MLPEALDYNYKINSVDLSDFENKSAITEISNSVTNCPRIKGGGRCILSVIDLVSWSKSAEKRSIRSQRLVVLSDLILLVDIMYIDNATKYVFQRSCPIFCADIAVASIQHSKLIKDSKKTTYFNNKEIKLGHKCFLIESISHPEEVEYYSASEDFNTSKFVAEMNKLREKNVLRGINYNLASLKITAICFDKTLKEYRQMIGTQELPLTFSSTSLKTAISHFLNIVSKYFNVFATDLDHDIVVSYMDMKKLINGSLLNLQLLENNNQQLCTEVKTLLSYCNYLLQYLFIYVLKNYTQSIMDTLKLTYSVKFNPEQIKKISTTTSQQKKELITSVSLSSLNLNASQANNSTDFADCNLGLPVSASCSPTHTPEGGTPIIDDRINLPNNIISSSMVKARSRIRGMSRKFSYHKTASNNSSTISTQADVESEMRKSHLSIDLEPGDCAIGDQKSNGFFSNTVKQYKLLTEKPSNKFQSLPITQKAKQKSEHSFRSDKNEFELTTINRNSRANNKPNLEDTPGEDEMANYLNTDKVNEGKEESSGKTYKQSAQELKLFHDFFMKKLPVGASTLTSCSLNSKLTPMSKSVTSSNSSLPKLASTSATLCDDYPIENSNDNDLPSSFHTSVKPEPPIFLSQIETKCLMNIPKKDLAEQITLIDAYLITTLPFTEFIDCAWSKTDKYNTSPHIINMINWFDHLADVVKSEILVKENLEDRVKAIEYFIKIAKELYELRNYNSMKAIISALNSQSIFRLEKTWLEVNSYSKKKLLIYNKLLSEDSNYSAYRQELAKSLPPNIPYMGVFLTDFTYNQLVAQKNPAVCQIKLKIAATQLEAYQAQCHYAFQNDMSIKTFLLNKLVKTDEESYLLSLQIEPKKVPKSHSHIISNSANNSIAKSPNGSENVSFQDAFIYNLSQISLGIPTIIKIKALSTMQLFEDEVQKLRDLKKEVTEMLYDKDVESHDLLNNIWTVLREITVAEREFRARHKQLQSDPGSIE